MNGQEASMYRSIRFMDNIEVKGEAVYSITERGIVIADKTMRTLIPWHRVLEFSYHNDDVTARNFIQGY